MSVNNITADEAIKILSTLSTPHVADTLAKGLTIHLKHQVMDAAIKPISNTMKVCGPAYTVRAYPGATYATEIAIAEAPARTVIVCDGQGSEAGVLMGGLMSTFAQSRGVLGAVLDGATRDIEEILELGFPMFARHITPRNGCFDQAGDVEHVISCGSVVVRPGDIVVGDLHGVVIVPQEIVVPTALAAKALEEREDAIQKAILAGKTLNEACAQFPSSPPMKVDVD